MEDTEEHQSENGGSGVALYEDMLDEDDTRLIIDEGGLPSEDNHANLTHEPPKKIRKTRKKGKSRKAVAEASTNYPCPHCGKMFWRKVKLQAHLATHKSKEELECVNCGRKYRDEDALFDHVCSGHKKKYKCPECDEWFRLKKNLTIHQQGHRKTCVVDLPWDDKDPCDEPDFSSFVESFVKWPVPCTNCGFQLANLEKYNVHMAAHKEGGPCVCSVCKMRFSCQDDYLLHKILCCIEGIYECTQCSKRFHTESKLSEHLASHSVEKLCCDICGLSFVSKDKLASHMKAHKTSIFVCAKCKKIFKCNSSLKSHTCTSDKSDKKLYTFAETSEKKVKVVCHESLSGSEESESEEGDPSPLVRETYSCQVCTDSFEQKEGLIAHLAAHFQCVDCRKYFKTQMDLDMHTFLLAEEKLYSCSLCEIVLHGKNELEYHLSNHLASSDVAYDDLDWEDNTLFLQNVFSGLDGAEPLQSTSLERSVANLKMHKVIPAGKDALKCSSCGKLVLLHHTLSTHIEPSTQVTDSEDEYVYISRLQSPQDKVKQAEDAYCACHQSSNILSTLSVQSPSKSRGDYVWQGDPTLISASQPPVPRPPPKATPEKSADLKSKSPLLDMTDDSSVVLLDVSDDESSHSERPNDSDTLKPGTETGYKTSNPTLLLNRDSNPTLLLNRDSTTSLLLNRDSNPTLLLNRDSNPTLLLNRDSNPTLLLNRDSNSTLLLNRDSTTSLAAKNDAKIKSAGTQLNPSNANLEGEKCIIFSKGSGIKVIKLANNKLESVPSRVDMKEFVANAGAGNGNLCIKPVKIVVSTGLLNPALSFGSVSELLSGGDTTKPVSGTKRPHAEINAAHQEELVLPSLTSKDGGKSFQTNALSASKKVKEEKSMKTLLPLPSRIKLVTRQPNGDILKTASSKNLSLESKSRGAKGDKQNAVSQPALESACASDVTEAKLTKNPKALGKTEPSVFRGNDSNDRSPKTRTQFKKREQGKSIARPDSSTPNANASENSFIPDRNMVFKVEKLAYESEEEEEEEEEEEDESLDFSGIKKEFLASDVFIKEEEWDIVDF